MVPSIFIHFFLFQSLTLFLLLCCIFSPPFLSLSFFSFSSPHPTVFLFLHQFCFCSVPASLPLQPHCFLFFMFSWLFLSLFLLFYIKCFPFHGNFRWLYVCVCVCSSSLHPAVLIQVDLLLFGSSAWSLVWNTSPSPPPLTWHTKEFTPVLEPGAWGHDSLTPHHTHTQNLWTEETWEKLFQWMAAILEVFRWQVCFLQEVTSTHTHTHSCGIKKKEKRRTLSSYLSLSIHASVIDFLSPFLTSLSFHLSLFVPSSSLWILTPPPQICLGHFLLSTPTCLSLHSYISLFISLTIQFSLKNFLLLLVFSLSPPPPPFIYLTLKVVVFLPLSLSHSV